MQTGREPSRGSALAAPRTPAVVPARPARPTLTLKGKVPAPPQQVVPERPAVDTAAASSPRVEPVEVVPAPKAAPVAPAVATDAPVKGPSPLPSLGTEPSAEHRRARYPRPSPGPQRPPRRPDPARGRPARIDAPRLLQQLILLIYLIKSVLYQ
jgi:hypothetical protein